MKPRAERLDQRLGDFQPLGQPIDEIHFERLLDRYGLWLVCNCPQLLFERREGWILPGWRRRRAPRDYPRASYDWPDYLHRDGLADWRYWLDPSGPNRTETLLERLNEAYRILDEIYAPPSKPSSQPHGPRPRHYSQKAGPRYP